MLVRPPTVCFSLEHPKVSEPVPSTLVEFWGVEFGEGEHLKGVFHETRMRGATTEEEETDQPGQPEDPSPRCGPRSDFFSF